MKDTCYLELLDVARRDLAKIAKRDPEWLLAIESAIEAVAEQGWVAATAAQQVKVLDQKRHIGEIRVLGKGGYRLLFFWFDDAGGRVLRITAVLKKKEVEDTRRLNSYVDAAAERRRRFLEDHSEQR